MGIKRGYCWVIRNISLKQEKRDFNMLKFKHALEYMLKISLLLMLATIQYNEIQTRKLPTHLHKLQHPIINRFQATKQINHSSPHHEQILLQQLTTVWESLSAWHSLMYPGTYFFQNMFYTLNKQHIKSTVEVQQCISITA